MERGFPSLTPDEPAERALALLSEGHPAIPVLYYGQLVGLVTAENMSEFFSNQRSHPGEPRVKSEEERAQSGV
jgi:hypothetical protein